jgi:hypothetical protein
MDRKSWVLAGAGAVLLASCVMTGHDGRQEWKLSRREGKTIRLSIDRWKPGSHWQTSTDVPFDRFKGLTPESFDRGGPVKFEYVQDAGRLICEGRISFGRGSGTFQFAPDPEFGAELKKLGYEAPTETQLFDMLLMGVTAELARVAKDAGLNATTRQLLDLRVHGVDPDYIRDVQETGYRRLSAQDYVDMKIHGVAPVFLRDLKGAGYDLSSKQVTELRIHGIDSDYLRELRDYGLRPEASDLVQLKIHGVTPEYLKGLKDAGYESLRAEQITKLRIHGVGTDFIEEARALQYDFSPDELTNLRIHGVDGRYLRRLRDSGMRNLKADQIQKLKMHGID